MKKKNWTIILGSAALLCSLFLLKDGILAALRAEPMPRLSPSPLAAPFVLNACKRGQPAHPASFLEISLTDSCAYSVGRSAVVASEFYEGPVGPVPALVIRPNDHDVATAPLVLVNLVGGPQGIIFDEGSESQFLRYSVRQAGENGVMTITPGYLGTSTRTLYPSSDIDPALEEIAALLEQLRKQRPTLPFCVVGGSMGGYLAASLLRNFPSTPMLALNPQMEAPLTIRRKNLEQYGRRFHYGSIRRHKLSGGQARFVQQEMALKMSIQEAFFGSYQDRNLADILDSHGRKMTLAYSPADERIGVDEVPELARRAPNVRIVKVSPVGHNISRVENFWAFRPVLDDFIGRCLSGRTASQG